MTISLPDELIMALVDGELDAGAAAGVRRAMRRQEALRRKYEIYRSTRAVVSRSFAAVAAEPVPERLRRTVAGGRRNLG